MRHLAVLGWHIVWHGMGRRLVGQAFTELAGPLVEIFVAVVEVAVVDMAVVR